MGQYSISTTTWYGEPCVVLHGGNLRATLLPGLGNNLISCTISGGEEILLTSPDVTVLRKRPAHYGIPILMPPGRIVEGRFHWGGRIYSLPRNYQGLHHSHGFLLRRPWHLVEVEVGLDSAWAVSEFRSADFEDVLAVFPHLFTVRVTYTVSGKCLLMTCLVRNDGDTPMPLGLGFHPYFLVSEVGILQVPVQREWELRDLLPTGCRLESELCKALARGIHVASLDLDHAFTVNSGSGKVTCHLLDSARGTHLTLRFQTNHFGHIVLYSEKLSSGFISIEPYSWAPNAPNLPLPTAETGVQTLAPGAETAFEWTLEIEFLKC